jgi:peptide/nickel transport system permease protein
MSSKVLLKRLLFSLITLFSAMVLTFFLLRLTPGNAYDKWAKDLAQKQGITFEEAREIVVAMSNYDPDEPLIKQFGRYANGLLHGDFGCSMYNEKVTVTAILAKALPWTIFIVTVALLISFIIGINLGVIMAWKRKSILNPIISIYATISHSIPNFLIAILFIIIFSFKLRWFPMRGAYDARSAVPGFNLKFILNVLHHAFLPILTFVFTTLGGWALSMKGMAVSVLGSDYINAAWIRGVSEKNIMKNYVKKNAIIPQITNLTISFAVMLGGTALIESQFNYPGLGYYMADATIRRDYTIMQGLLFVTSFAVVIANFLAELIYAKLDPRVRTEE